MLQDVEVAKLPYPHVMLSPRNSGKVRRCDRESVLLGVCDQVCQSVCARVRVCSERECVCVCGSLIVCGSVRGSVCSSVCVAQGVWLCVAVRVCVCV